MINWERASFRYDPFPFGVATQIFSDTDYAELLSTYPTPDLFASDAALEGRYTLGHYANVRAFRSHLRSQPAWRELYAWIHTAAFLTSLLDMLRAHEIDLGVSAQPLRPLVRLAHLARALRAGRLSLGPRVPRAELTFAMLPAAGGYLLPHTDHPNKLVNLAMTMVKADEWESAAGGGTDINLPKDPRRTFNRANRRLSFDEVTVLDTVPYRPNQTLIVIRTDNSWHSVPPMTAKGSAALRKTVNINILH